MERPKLRLRNIDRYIVYSLVASVLWFGSIVILAVFPWQ